MTETERIFFEQEFEQEFEQGNDDYDCFFNTINSFLEEKANIKKACLESNDPIKRLEYAQLLSVIGKMYDITRFDYIETEKLFSEAISITKQILLEFTHIHAEMIEMKDEMKDEKEILLLDIKRLYVEILIYCITFYTQIKEFSQANKFFLEAESITKELREENPELISGRGLYYKAIGNDKKAEKYLLKAKNMLESRKDTETEEYVRCLDALGSIYISMGEYASQIKEFSQADKFFLAAEKYLFKAKDIFENVLGENNFGYLSILERIMDLYLSMGNYSKTEEFYIESKNKMESGVKPINDIVFSFWLIGIGIKNIKEKDYHEAKNCLYRSRELIRYAERLDHPDNAIILSVIGFLFDSIQYHSEAESIIEKIFSYEEALELEREAYQLNKSMVIKNFSFFSKAQREAYWNKNLRLFELPNSITNFFHVPETNAISYDNALFSKGLLLRAANAVRNSVYSSGNESIIKEFEKLCSLYQKISDMKQSEKSNKALIMKMEEDAKNIDKTIMDSLSAYKDAYENWKADISLRWQDVRDSLREGEAAIEFVSFSLNKYAALVLRPGMESPEWVPICKETGLAEIFTKLSGKTPEKQIEILYGKDSDLYVNVWQPLETILEGVTTVYYSPSGLLHKVSFNAIPVKGVRLMDLYDMNFVSSTREVVNRNKRNSHKPESAAIFGGIKYNLSKEDIKGDKSKEAQDDSKPHDKFRDAGKLTEFANMMLESKFIQKQFEKNKIRSVLYIGADGNKKKFMSLDRKKTNVIHLATHGFFIDDIKKKYKEDRLLEQFRKRIKDYDNPLRRSAIALAGANNWLEKSPVKVPGNGMLLADDVADMNLEGADMVVLSACETALGKVDNSEGVFGLQRAFKLAGAQTLLMSLWKVVDESTKELMTEFYQNWLSKGMSKQESFKNAQKQLREKYPSPYHWAAFVMID
jgi:CHAT domain-containing protein